MLRVEWQLTPAPQSCFTAAAHGSAAAPAISAPVSSGNGSAVSTLEEIERQHFIQVLRKTRGVIEGPHGAARLLDLKPSTARFRIKKLGIRREHYES